MSEVATVAAAATPPPAAELTLTSNIDLDFKRCLCIGVMAGRACTLCNNTRWLKRCEECNGSGKIFRNRMASSNRSPSGEIHGRCMGRGWLAVSPSEMREMVAASMQSPSTPPGDSKKKK